MWVPIWTLKRVMKTIVVKPKFYFKKTMLINLCEILILIWQISKYYKTILYVMKQLHEIRSKH